MRKSSIRLYGPFLALMVVQGLIIAVAPSQPPERAEVAAFDPDGGFEGGDGSDGTGIGAGTDGTDGLTTDGTLGTDGALDGTVGTTGGADGSGGTGGGTGGTGSTGGGTDGGTGGGGSGGPSVPGGDRSHCKGDRQFDILIDNPPCVAKFTGDNGGSTYQGVTGDTIKVIFFSSEPNAALEAVLAPQGLAATQEEQDAMHAAMQKFVAERYELYGRKLEIERITGDCPTTPPDVPACKEAIRQVIRKKPFLVVWGTSLYAEVFDELARAGIPSISGGHFDDSYYTGRRPFRYDLFMDGTRSADLVGEYFCKKLAKKPASHAGQVIHPSIGGRNTIRKVGIIVPEIDANLRTARRLEATVERCSGQQAEVVTYVSDIERAQEQTDATVQKLIRTQTTTVVCLCDPIAPVFLTNGLTRAAYFPEHLMAGIGLIDYDLLGRLYDPAQWVHAFGPGHLADPIPHDQSNATRVWRSVGNSGVPCKGCNLISGFYTLVAAFLQSTGPNLNPTTMERAVLTSAPSGGAKPGSQLIKFGPGDYTGISDAREVYWNPNARSKIDGANGAYVAVNGARRYELGQWDNSFTIPVPPR